MRSGLALLALAAAWTLLLLDVEPVPTWFYVFIWYPTLVLMDDVASRRDGQPRLFARPRVLLSLLLWSPVVWLVFEAVNFRLGNWYYVFLPHHGVERWAGILISFATVLPAVVLAERLLASFGVAAGWRTRPLASRAWEPAAAAVLGITMTVLILAWPRTFFPLTWGAAWLLVDPWLSRRRPQWSLFADMQRGTWGRIGRLMLSGLLIGLLWEGYNFLARGKWVYTVPWLEQTKLFEMPPLGFLGFPFFALEVWVMYHALCASGVALPLGGAARTSLPRAGVAAVLAATCSVMVLWGMERMTVSSTVPQLEDLPGVTAADADRLRASGVPSVFALADGRGDARAALGEGAGDRAVAEARLVTLRGIGAVHGATLRSLGVADACALARQDPLALWERIRTRTPAAATRRALPAPAEVRVWVGAARRACGR